MDLTETVGPLDSFGGHHGGRQTNQVATMRPQDGSRSYQQGRQTDWWPPPPPSEATPFLFFYM
jgi:hypothetical protein